MAKTKQISPDNPQEGIEAAGGLSGGIEGAGQAQGKAGDEAAQVGKPGKSLEDLAKELESLRGEIGRRDKIIEAQKGDISFYEDRLRRREAADERYIQKEEKAIPQEEPTWDYENPIASVRKIWQTENQREKEERERAEKKRQATEAQHSYVEGQRMALRSNPKLFDGIEKAAGDLVYQSYMNGIVAPWQLRDPETWEMAARLIHLKNSNFDALKPSIRPMANVTAGEIPPQAKARDEDVPDVSLDYNDDEVRNVMKAYKLTREQAEEIIREEQERIAKGDPTDIRRRR